MQQLHQRQALEIFCAIVLLSCINVHTVDAISNIERWHNLQRDAKGNILILFWGVCMFYYQYDGGPIPAKLRGISIRSIMIDGVLVQQVKGWLILAKAILPEKSQAKYINSLGSTLMTRLAHAGSVHNKISHAFGDMHEVVRNRIYNDNTSIIAVHDHRLPDVSFLNRTTIRALRLLRSPARNVEYGKIYKPGLFVDGGSKMSQGGARKITGQGGNAEMKMRRMKQQWNEQETDDRIEEVINGHMVSYGLP